MGRILSDFSALPLESSSFSLGNMLALHMQHITVKGVGFSGDEVVAPLDRADVPRGHSSVEGIPMCEVFFLRDEIKPGSPYHHTFRVIAFIMGSPQAPLIGHFDGVQSILLAYLITNVSHLVVSMPKGFEGVPTMILVL